MAREIDDYRCLDISKLKKWGYLTPDPNTAFKQGVITWERMGETVAQISIGVCMSSASPSIAVIYTYNGTPKRYKIQLQYIPSNLPDRANTGYYYFVCPVTGYLCRKLYLVNGVFMSRRAFRPLYWAQTMSRKQRAFNSLMEWDALLLVSLMEKELGDPYHRKETYRGKPTPYGRRVARWNRKLQNTAAAQFLN